MGSSKAPTAVKLITALITGRQDLISETTDSLEALFKNTVERKSPVIDFSFTDYYRDEMGPALKRVLLSFEKPVPLEGLYATKIGTNDLESRFSESGKRRINIDPGYLDLAKVVLFSTKDYNHRIYLSGGIYAEVTLFYRNNTFNGWPWTYPDYKTKEYIDFFNLVREDYNTKGDRCL
jgi:endonuclease IV